MADPIQRADVAPEEPSRGRRLDAGRALVLGVNAWALLAVLPLFVGVPRSPAAIVWLAAPLPFLFAGAALVPWHRQIAAWLLLGAFPTSLGGVVAAMAKLTEGSPFGPWSLSIGALSLLAFGASAARATNHPLRVRAAVWRPLGNVAPLEEPPVRRWGRRLLVAATGAGALALALVAPTVGDSSALVGSWGEAADQAATLGAVVGGALGSSLLALIVGPGLRANRRRRVTRRQSRRRVAALVALAIASSALYALQVLGR